MCFSKVRFKACCSGSLFMSFCVVKLQDSFVRAKSWVKELQRLANTDMVIALAGNKADLASKRAVEFAVRCGFCQPKKLFGENVIGYFQHVPDPFTHMVYNSQIHLLIDIQNPKFLVAHFILPSHAEDSTQAVVGCRCIM